MLDSLPYKLLRSFSHQVELTLDNLKPISWPITSYNAEYQSFIEGQNHDFKTRTNHVCLDAVGRDPR